jgi:succinate-semialdehyde dehydrogenase/glutarate-semialdehyde dehydrogenase
MFDVRNPATGEILALLPNMGEAEAEAAVEAGERAMQSSPPPQQRRDWLMAIHDRMLTDRESFGRLITLEHGKPLKEGITEVEYTAGFFRFFAEQIDRLEAERLPGLIRNCRWTIHHRPAGVAGLITPWNFPLAMIGKKVAPALAAGCAAVIKPAKEAPLSTIALCAVAEQVGVPAGRLNVLVGSAAPIGAVLCRHPAVRLVSFTGSTEVGRLLIANTAPHIKKLAMELGGNAPFIVFEDADLEAAANALISNKFRASGQTCVCTNRVYVHRSIASPFTDAVAERVRKLRVGNGLDPETDIGPLINRDAFDKVADHVRDALARGATRLAGDDPPRPASDWGAFYPPTVLTGVTPDMLVCREETFGPVVAISEFDDEDRVIEAANSTCYGLAAYVFTRSADRAATILSRLRFGHVGLNTGTGPTPEAPFGGMKQSGFGREGGLEGLLEFCDTQVVATP